MARTTKEDEYAARRKDILDSARRLVYTKGFDQMTIQDILDDLKISKGAFYHYFDSKADVMQTLIEHMTTQEVAPILTAIVYDPNLTALEKLHAYFDASARWKAAQRDVMLSLTRVYYSDENAVFRQKMFAFATQEITPLLGEIVSQGVREGVFTTPYPEQFGQVIIYIIQGLADNLIPLLLRADELEQDDPLVIKTVTEYIDALEDAIARVLGAPSGSIELMKPEMIQFWFSAPKENAGPVVTPSAPAGTA